MRREASTLGVRLRNDTAVRCVSPSVKTEGFDTSLTEGGKGTDCHDQSADWSRNDSAEVFTQR